jgi:hypothetical protein
VAHSTLPVFSHPHFQQVLEALTGSEIRHVEQALGLCSHESPESRRGACNGGFPCTEVATVHHLASGLEYCAGHFEEADRA